MQYYYTTLDHQTAGPVGLDGLRVLMQTGAIDASCKVAAVGTQEWLPITSIIAPAAPAPVAPALPIPPPAPAVAQSPVIRTEPLAIWSLVLGVLALFCCGFLVGIPAVICGHLALGRINRTPGLEGKGFAIAGLSIGYFATVAWLIYLFAMGGIAILQGLSDAS